MLLHTLPKLRVGYSYAWGTATRGVQLRVGYSYVWGTATCGVQLRVGYRAARSLRFRKKKNGTRRRQREGLGRALCWFDRGGFFGRSRRFSGITPLIAEVDLWWQSVGRGAVFRHERGFLPTFMVSRRVVERSIGVQEQSTDGLLPH